MFFFIIKRGFCLGYWNPGRNLANQFLWLPTSLYLRFPKNPNPGLRLPIPQKAQEQFMRDTGLAAHSAEHSWR